MDHCSKMSSQIKYLTYDGTPVIHTYNRRGKMDKERVVLADPKGIGLSNSGLQPTIEKNAELVVNQKK